MKSFQKDYPSIFGVFNSLCGAFAEIIIHLILLLSKLFRKQLNFHNNNF